MILHLKPCLMWCMLFVGNINLTNMTELGDLTLDPTETIHSMKCNNLQIDDI